MFQVTRKQAGNYSCHASNVEGDAESAPVTLTIMCKSSNINMSKAKEDQFLLLKFYLKYKLIYPALQTSKITLSTTHRRKTTNIN